MRWAEGEDCYDWGGCDREEVVPITAVTGRRATVIGWTGTAGEGRCIRCGHGLCQKVGTTVIGCSIVFLIKHGSANLRSRYMAKGHMWPLGCRLVSKVLQHLPADRDVQQRVFRVE